MLWSTTPGCSSIINGSAAMAPLPVAVPPLAPTGAPPLCGPPPLGPPPLGGAVILGLGGGSHGPGSVCAGGVSEGPVGGDGDAKGTIVPWPVAGAPPVLAEGALDPP